MISDATGDNSNHTTSASKTNKVPTLIFQSTSCPLTGINTRHLKGDCKSWNVVLLASVTTFSAQSGHLRPLLLAGFMSSPASVSIRGTLGWPIFFSCLPALMSKHRSSRYHISHRCIIGHPAAKTMINWFEGLEIMLECCVLIWCLHVRQHNYLPTSSNV